MITQVYISGSVQKAVFRKRGRYYIHEKSEDNTFKSFPINIFDFNNFTLSNAEVSFYEKVSWDSTRLNDELVKDIDKQNALRFCLMGLDSELSLELKSLSIKYLSELFEAKVELKEFVLNRIFGTVLPIEFNPKLASEIANEIECVEISQIYKNLYLMSELIVDVRNSWKSTLLDFSDQSNFHLNSLDKEFTDKGVFKEIVLALKNGNYNEIDALIVKYSSKIKGLKKEIKPAIFLTKFRDNLFDALSIEKNIDNTKSLAEIRNIDISKSQVVEYNFNLEFQRQINNYKGLSQQVKEQGKGKKLKGLFKKRSTVSDTIEIIGKQVDWIKDKIFSNDIEEAKKTIIDLISFQNLNSEAEDLCKSLSDIAKQLQKKRYFELSNLLSDGAINLNPNDIVPYTIKAGNLRYNHKFEESLSVFNYVEKNLIVDRYVLSGKATTYRKMYEFDKALELYDLVLDKFGLESGTLIGKADTLKSMGRYQEAIQLYEEIILNYPDNSLGLIGKAESLKLLGRLEESLLVYGKAIINFSDDIYTKSGKVEVLKLLGRLDEALEFNEEIIESYKFDVVPLTMKAGILNQMNRFEESLNVYDEAIQKFKNHIYPRIGKAGVLKQIGKLDESLDCYENAVKDINNHPLLISGMADVLKRLNRPDEALKLVDETMELFPHSQYLKKVKILIEIHLNKNLKSIECQLKESLKYKDPILFHIYCMLLLKMGKVDKSIKLLNEGLKRYSDLNNKKYFQNALIYAYIKKKKYVKALKIKSNEHSNNLDPVNSVLICHAFAGNGNFNESNKILEIFNNSKIETFKQVSKLISSRFDNKNLIRTNLKNNLDSQIEEIEFQLLTEQESYLPLAA